MNKIINNYNTVMGKIIKLQLNSNTEGLKFKY